MSNNDTQKAEKYWEGIAKQSFEKIIEQRHLLDNQEKIIKYQQDTIEYWQKVVNQLRVERGL